ncbi:D-glycero-beta-D-manno-heptose 1,7-bisphosphate 7-phosphatase [Geomesophilobacter sediminis]|uniref:D,D-heptose 1,7-bisphosphate phosphatase n=1 Tax=Geomesophilobacter sediminis TaxID=2798584 RepID=A0A8J7J9H3_9BACT|nr:D-glycero-beta-D-manno-heptose 1,7-bisphosphate 7-phosphatase [Geomesophilobacter sediminis]MBJ6723261.1 D-glycero-beta-D-manno-heptose 1,7-bisphosphate 7-phosphatase [Geomesophilobacter sediminis]
MGTRKAVFLDRDGTINVEVEYLSRVEDFQFIPGAPLAIKSLKEAGFLLVVVTNQSGIGRGYYDETALERVHRFMHEELEKFGVSIDACYFCPHHPEHGVGPYRIDCACRKPLPGMLLQAAHDLNIDLAASYMIGDKLADVKAGLKAGCSSILVQTGYGAKDVARLPAGVATYPDILSAAEAIIAQSNEEKAGAK